MSNYELVQVHERPDGTAEVLVRDRNSFKAYGGICKLHLSPKSVYPPDYFRSKDENQS